MIHREFSMNYTIISGKHCIELVFDGTNVMGEVGYNPCKLFRLNKNKSL